MTLKIRFFYVLHSENGKFVLTVAESYFGTRTVIIFAHVRSERLMYGGIRAKSIYLKLLKEIVRTFLLLLISELLKNCLKSFNLSTI